MIKSIVRVILVVGGIAAGIFAVCGLDDYIATQNFRERFGVDEQFNIHSVVARNAVIQAMSEVKISYTTAKVAIESYNKQIADSKGNTVEDINNRTILIVKKQAEEQSFNHALELADKMTKSARFAGFDREIEAAGYPFGRNPYIN
jgi:hypothetical protein